MKKLVLLFIVLTLIVSNISVNAADKQLYELWTESPYITSGITMADLNIHRAINLNEFDIYKLNRLGGNIYLGMAEKKSSTGGSSGKSKTSDLFAYTFLVNNGDYIILSELSISEEYWWDYGINLRDLSSEVWNTNWYTSRGYQVPYYIFQGNSMYSNTSYGYGTTYPYIVITNTGKLCQMTTSYRTTDAPIAYNGLLYLQQDYYPSGSNYYRYTNTNGYYQTKLMPIAVNSSGTLIYDTSSAEMRDLSGTTLNIGQTNLNPVPANVGQSNFNKISGSTDKFFTVDNVPRLDTSTNITYYDVVVSSYRVSNYTMTLLGQKRFTTANTYPYGFTTYDLGDLDRTYYSSKSSLVPRHIINGKYIIFEDGTISALDPERINSSTYVNGGWNYCVYNNRIAIVRDRNGSNVIYKKDPANNYYYYWQEVNYTYFNGTTMCLESDIELPIYSGPNTGQNGYYKNYNSYVAPTLNTVAVAGVTDWLMKDRAKTFPDGRRVEVRWNGIGNNIYELWYDIYNADGTRRATGPTGYSTQFGSVFDTYAIDAIVINNSKFIAYINQIDHGFMREYYRVAVAEENTGGEVISGGGSVGTKKILPPNTTDTEPVQSTIDFAQDNLPLGYNIKSNVVGSAKLDVNLRQQVNTIRLNDIVILKKSGYISGSHNAGVGLSSYSNYDYGFGSDYIRFYSNGQNFQWYCYNPENLTAGTYNKIFYIDDKTIYVTIKVIVPPNNNGVTTVTF